MTEIRRRERLLGQMRCLEAELEHLAEAVARGGDLPALLHAIKEWETQRSSYERELTTRDSTRRLGRLDRARIERGADRLAGAFGQAPHASAGDLSERTRRALDFRAVA